MAGAGWRIWAARREIGVQCGGHCVCFFDFSGQADDSILLRRNEDKKTESPGSSSKSPYRHRRALITRINVGGCFASFK
jgi:hypothetical protein